MIFGQGIQQALAQASLTSARAGARAQLQSKAEQSMYITIYSSKSRAQSPSTQFTTSTIISTNSSHRLLKQIMAHTPRVTPFVGEQLRTRHVKHLPPVVPRPRLLLPVRLHQVRPYRLLILDLQLQPVLRSPINISATNTSTKQGLGTNYSPHTSSHNGSH